MVLLAAAAAAGTTALFALIALTIFSVEVNGPLYAHIVQGKDLLTDVLPPPLSAIEPYLLVERMALGSKAARAELVRKFRRLEKDFEDRDADWMRSLRDPALRAALERSSRPGHAFFEVVERELLPAWERGDAVRAAAALDRVRALYAEHRAAVETLVDEIEGSNASVESAARVAVGRRLAIALALSLIVLGTVVGMVLASGGVLIRQIGALSRESQKLTEAVHGGALDVRASPDSVSAEFRAVVDGMNSTMAAVAAASAARVRAERALADERERLRVAFTASLDSIAMSRLDDGTFVTVNEGFTRLTGWTAKEAIGKSALLLGLWVDADQGAELREAVQAGKLVSNFEATLRRRDGTTVVVLISSQVIVAAGDRLVLTFTRDISERKRNEELRAQLLAVREIERLNDDLRQQAAELATANARLQEVDRLKSEFLTTMSHELRTPLNSILGFTGIVREGMAGPLTDEQTKQLGMVQASARHLLSLINDLLDLSRIEAGRLILAADPFDFMDVVSEVVESLEPTAALRELVLRTEERSAPIDMVGDRTRCFQVLLNLTSNAVKFTERGEVRITVQTEGGRLRVAVADTGIGIKPEHIGLLFQPFRQVDGSAKRVHEGTGLGLYLCRKLLTLMGGDIAVESEFQRGSRFTFWLPLRPEA